MRRGLFLLLGIVAQDLYAQDLRFQHLTTEDGLSDNAVTCLFEDRVGSMWIGTENGLDRYDGSSVWNVPGTKTHITAVVGDREGTIWAATRDHGLLRVDPDLGVSHAFRKNDGVSAPLGSDLLTALYDLDDTTLLIGAREHALLFFDKRTFACTYWADSLDLSPGKARSSPPFAQGWCHTITELNDELLWIGFLHSGNSLVVDRSSARTVRRLVIHREGSETQTCAALVGDTLFSGGWQNDIDAIHLSPSQGTHVEQAEVLLQLPVADEVSALLRYDGTHLLAGSRGIGLFMVDLRNGSVRRHARSRSDPNSPADDRIRALFRDSRQILWVATANGLDRYVPGVWQMQRTDLYADPRQDHPELLFHRVEPLGSLGARVFSSGGFFLADQDGTVRQVPVRFEGRELQPTVLAPGAAGGQWLGTEYGIVSWDDALGRITGIHDLRSEGGAAYPVGGMYQVRGLERVFIDGQERSLAATLGYGVHCIDPAMDRVEGVAMPATANSAGGLALVNDLCRASDGRFWYGTTAGIVSWSSRDPLLSTAFAGRGSGRVLVPGEDVRRLMEQGGSLWAVTRGGEVVKVREGVAQHFAPPSHLSTGFHGFAIDGRGRLWITTDDGLLRFDPEDTSFVRISVGDGAGVRKLTRAITGLPDGRLAFCADNALFTFDPRAYDVLPEVPVPYIVGASVAGRPLSITDGRAVLSYRSSVIDITVSALAHGFPKPPVFEYRLDGVESDRHTTPVGDAIRYAGIPVGEHRLLVRVRDPFGRIGPERVLLTVQVSGPIWQQWWFYALGLLVVSVGLYALYNYRLAQAMKLQSIRDRIASDLHDEVGSSLSSIAIGAQLATRLTPGASDQVKKLLARMGETSSESLRSISDIVWAIDPKNDEGEALVKRMRRIAQELLESKGVTVRFDVGEGVEDLKLPMNGRKEIVLIFKEAVHNASKYSGAQLVQVGLHRRNGTLAVSVLDDGRGFDTALHPDGHGLGSMRRRAEALGTALTLKSAPSAGTLVAVEVDLTRIRD